MCVCRADATTQGFKGKDCRAHFGRNLRLGHCPGMTHVPTFDLSQSFICVERLSSTYHRQAPTESPRAPATVTHRAPAHPGARAPPPTAAHPPLRRRLSGHVDSRRDPLDRRSPRAAVAAPRSSIRELQKKTQLSLTHNAFATSPSALTQAGTGPRAPSCGPFVARVLQASIKGRSGKTVFRSR